jgi:(p)ppGpp synthase/HD superfamily hydrolase
MKKYILPMLASAALIASAGFTSEEKPKVSICNAEEGETENSVKSSLQETRKKVAELAHDNKTVMKNFDAFAEILNSAYRKEKSMTVQEIQQICSALEFAADKHRLQTRKNPEKTPYISHPIGVAYNLMSVGEVRDSSIIMGALLHDTVEDTQTTFEEIEAKFGKQVTGYVRELTDDRSLAKEARKRLQVINASNRSKGAAQIKLADKLYNLNDLFINPPDDWTQARIDRYYEWAQSVVDRLPKSNDKLLSAVDDLINSYWEKQQPTKS